MAPPPPAADHHAIPSRAPAAATAGVEALGHSPELRAPRDVLVKALLGLLRDADALPAGLLAEPGDAARGRALLLLGAAGGGEVLLRQRPDDHDLVVLDRYLHPREPAVREPSGKPTLDRTELFVIHGWHDRHYMITLQQVLPTCGEARRGRRPG